MKRRAMRPLCLALLGLALSGPAVAQGQPAAAPKDPAPLADGEYATKQIVLIRPGSSGLLPDEDTIDELLGSWQWPESIGPAPAVQGILSPAYSIDFAELQSRNPDAILGIVTVRAFTEPQAVRRAQTEVIDYLEGALAQIGAALEESRQTDIAELVMQIESAEKLIEELETRQVELRSEGGVDAGNWQGQLEALRAQATTLSAQLGEQRMRYDLIRDQLELAKKSAAESANSGQKTLDALKQLVQMQIQEVQRAESLAEKGAASKDDLNRAREQVLQAEIQLREKEQQLSSQVSGQVRGLSNQEQILSREIQAMEKQRQDMEQAMARLQSDETRAKLVEQQKIVRQLERARTRLAEAEQRHEQLLARRLADPRPPKVIRIESKSKTQ